MVEAPQCEVTPDSDTDSLRAGRELNVDTVLDSRIRRLGDRVRVTAQLVSVCDGAALWAGKFDELFTNLFAVEDSISQVASALLLKLRGDEGWQLAKRYTESAEAYQPNLLGSGK